jgi:hypothetical protein
MDLGATVCNDAHDYFLPSIAAPRLGSVAGTQVGNVLHDGVKGTRKEEVVFVVHGHDDKDLCLAVVDLLTECEFFLLKVVGIRRARLNALGR